MRIFLRLNGVFNFVLMRTITVELINEQALQLLEQLEQLQILRLIKDSDTPTSSPNKRQWAGSLSKETAQNMLHQLDQSRNEWERDI